MRKLTEFLFWNHIFILYETYYSLIYGEYVLFTLSFVTTFLSYYRHLHRETKCNTCEPYFAKGTELYMTLISFYYFNMMEIVTLLYLKSLMLFIWKIEWLNYETIHPWLHVIVALDAHYYLSCYREHFIEL